MSKLLAATALFLACCGAPPPVAAPVPVASHTVRGAEHVVFASRDGDLTHGAPTRLDGYVFAPAAAGPNTHPAVILLHGCAGLFSVKTGDLTARHREWAERLAAQGYVVLLPDSFNPRGVDEICTRAVPPVRPDYERTRDAYAALEFLAARPDVDPARIALLGWSNGGSTLLNTLAAHTRARPPNLAHDFRVAVAMYPGCQRVLARTDWAPPVAPIHVLIGAADDWTPAQPCVDLVDRVAAAGAPADIIVYPGAYHDFDDPLMGVHTRHNVATTASHTATIGQDPAARAAAITRVTTLLHDALAAP